MRNFPLVDLLPRPRRPFGQHPVSKSRLNKRNGSVCANHGTPMAPMKPPALLSEELATAYDQLAQHLSRHVVPICQDDAQGRPEQIGTGLLMAGGDRSHLVSAAHVLKLAKIHAIAEPFRPAAPVTRIMEASIATDICAL